MTVSRQEIKREIRKSMKKLEEDFLSHGDVRGESEAIWRQVEESEEFRNASTVLLYMAIPGEVPTREFIDKWSGRKRIVIPKVNGEELDLYEYDPSRLQEGYKGIQEPSEDAKKVCPEEIDLALVPGVAFTGEGSRLGRGKGFYDRLLPHLKCPCAGVGFSFRWIDEIPSDPWDVSLQSGYGSMCESFSPRK